MAIYTIPTTAKMTSSALRHPKNLYAWTCPASACSLSYLPIHKAPFSDASCTCKERLKGFIFAHCNSHDTVTRRFKSRQILLLPGGAAILLYLRGAHPRKKWATLKAIVHLSNASMHYSLTACSRRAARLQDAASRANNSQSAGFGGASNMATFYIA